MALNKFRLICALSLVFFSTVIADAEVHLIERLSTTEQEFQFQRMLSSPLRLEPRQCAATCEGHCVPASDYVCCPGTGGEFCRPGERCCGSENCAPSGTTCCPDGGYARAGRFCCPDGGTCPIGDTCDGIYCRFGSGATGVGQISASAPATTSTRPPVTTSLPTEVIAWQWYYFTITWYYYTWYYSYDAYLEATDVFSSTIYSTTTLSVSTSDSAAASEWFTSISRTISLPTPASATPLPRPTSSTRIPSSTTTPTTPPVTAIPTTFPSSSLPTATSSATFVNFSTSSQPTVSTSFAQVSANVAGRNGYSHHGANGFEVGFFYFIAGLIVIPGILVLWF